MAAPPLQRVLQKLDLEPLKVPLGFIRLVELIFCLIAYGAYHGWEFTLQYSCKGDKNMSYSWTDINIHNLQIKTCNGSNVFLFDDEYAVGGDFYAYLLVISIFFTLASLLFYLFWWNIYTADDRLPVLDLAITVILAFAWLIGTLCFSITAGKIEEGTEEEKVVSLLKTKGYCDGDNTCTDIASYRLIATFSIATIASCGCVLLFFANIWFCYKETPIFRSRHTHNIQMQQEPYTLE